MLLLRCGKEGKEKQNIQEEEEEEEVGIEERRWAVSNRGAVVVVVAAAADWVGVASLPREMEKKERTKEKETVP